MLVSWKMLMRMLNCSRITLEASVGVSWRRSREASEEAGLVQGTDDEAGLAQGQWEEWMMRVGEEEARELS